MSNTPSDDGFHISTELNFQRPELSEFLEYWEQKKGDREFPQRSDIKPAEIVRLLPWINMYDVLDGGEEFSVRVVGTALTEVIGEEMRGKTVSGLSALLVDRVMRTLRAVLETRVPVHAASRSTAIPGQEFQGAEVCAVPLSTNGTDIDIIMAATYLETRR